MESLLANYGGSDDEDDVVVNHVVSAPDVLCTKAEPSTRPSLFAHLPPPSLEFGGSRAGDRLKHGIAGALPPPKNARPHTWGDDNVDQETPPKRNEQQAGPLAGKLSALLPPPRNTSGLGVSGPQKKKTVEFRPPVNVALLEMDVEDERPSKKINNLSSKAVGAPGMSGLAAILPPPKHSLGLGAVLGSGAGSGGRRTVMETQSRLSTDHTSSAATNSDAALEHNSGYDTVDYSGSEEYRSGDASLTRQQSLGHGCSPSEQEGYVFAEGEYSGEQSWQRHESHTCLEYEQAPSAEVAEDPLARVLQSERKRGRAMPTIIEVKQSDLTGGNLREDKLKSTGIAFGPAYQPVASSKNKPSKIHRRKHQIGSLYFDMKQREMELLERRSRGQMTKAETQAKYGW